MKKYLRLLLAILFVVIVSPTFAGTEYGCEGYYTLKIGERATLRRTIGHYPSNWTRVNWVVAYSGKSVKIVSQDYDYCTIEAEAECSNVKVYCQMYYNGDLSSLYYDITVSSEGKLTVTASPEGGNVLPGEKVTLSTNYSGATIYYTLNGSTPTTSSTVYTSSGITINNNCTLKAIATKKGYTDSNVFTAYYTVSNTFTSKTIEGVDMKFKILDETEKTCEVTKFAIPQETTGEITIPAEVNGYKVMSIGEDAFCNRSSITSFSIPNSVTKIGLSAFQGCSSLVSISIPNSVTNIESVAFSGCKSLTSVSIPNSVTSLGNHSFYMCENLEDITLSASLKRLEKFTFYGCPIKDITGYNNIEYIADNAIPLSCPWVNNLPEGMNFIGKVLYNYQGKIPANTTLNIPDGCTQIYSSLSFNQGLVGINIPASVKHITDGVLNNCDNLQSITVDAGNSVYDSRNNCNAIIEKSTNRLVCGCNATTIPTNVKSIGKLALSGVSWEEILIPNSVDSIAENAFSNSDKVKSILIGKGLRKLSNYAFYGLNSLEEIQVVNTNPYFDSRDNCNAIIEKSTNKLVLGCVKTVIPNTVKVIGSRAFYQYNNKDFTSLVIPNSVEEIETDAIHLRNLQKVSIGKNVTKFGRWIFSDCEKLQFIESLNSFPDDIDELVFSIGVGQNNFLYENVTLYVPVGCRNNYRLATGWSNFKNIVEGTLETGIDNVFITNPDEHVIYSPTGIRLSDPQHGLNIINGKKLLVR